ncbi:MAG: hypothetical protein Aureis2KO_17480 [Aureisphaera sp.]
MIICKTEYDFDLFLIESMTEILIDHDKVLMEPSLIDSWFRKNAETLLNKELKRQLSPRSYDSLLVNLSKTIEYFDDCKPVGTGDHSLITFSTNSLNGSYNFDCKINWEIDWVTYEFKH